MHLPKLNSDALALIGRVYDKAWRELQGKTYFRSEADKTRMRTAVATCIIAAVAIGERRPQRLRSMALEAGALSFPVDQSLVIGARSGGKSVAANLDECASIASRRH